MSRGKDKCDMLRAIRRQVAEKYGLKYSPRECRHEGDCSGTCPVCDAELKDLQCQLEQQGITDIDLPHPENMDAHFENKDSPVTDIEDSFCTQGLPMPYDIWEEGEPCRPMEGDAATYRPPYKNCYIAGLSFHNINDIWEELYEGAPLALVRQHDNKYDANAVAVALAGDYDPESPDSFDFKFILGYIPRNENEDIAAMMDDGYQFDAEISELDDDDDHHNKQIEIAIYLQDEEHRQPSTRLRALSIGDDTLTKQIEWLKNKGIMYFRWRCALPMEESHNLPIKGENVVILHRRKSDTLIYLTKVIAIDDEANFLFDNPEEEILLVDDCAAYILGNIAGPITTPNWALDFLLNEPVDSRQPEHFLSETAQAKLEQIVGLA